MVEDFHQRWSPLAFMGPESVFKFWSHSPVDFTSPFISFAETNVDHIGIVSLERYKNQFVPCLSNFYYYYTFLNHPVGKVLRIVVANNHQGLHVEVS